MDYDELLERWVRSAAAAGRARERLRQVRRRMKISIALAVSGIVLLGLEAVLGREAIAAVSTDPSNPLLQYWPVITGMGLLLVTGANVRSSVEAHKAALLEHKEWVKAEVAAKADREMVELQLKHIADEITGIRRELNQFWREHRERRA